MKMCTVLISLILISIKATIISGYVRGCYYTNWAQYRPEGKGQFKPEDIPKGLCTHILYAFAKVDDSGNSIPFEWNDEDTERMEGGYSRVMKLKQSDASLKVLLSYGGYTFGSTIFTAIAKSAEKRKHFIASAIAFLRKHKFDGFDFDWEYPSGVAEDHAKLIKEMKAAFVEEANTSGNQQLLLTAAVSAGKETIDKSYNVQSLGEDFDYLFLMSYDFHGQWDKNVDLHGKLRATKGETAGIGIFNTEYAANYWESKGMPKKKIVIGIPTYGRGWTLANPSETAIGASAIGQSSPSITNPDGGTAAYWEICQYLIDGGKETVDEQGVGAYMVKGNQWYGYDNEETIKIKMKWIKQKGYGGAFIWTLDFDDFSGANCGKGRYPLMNAINGELGSETEETEESSELTITMPQTTKSSATDTKSTESYAVNITTVEQKESPDLMCPEDNGIFPHPSDCHLFIQCVHGHPYVKQCAVDAFYNEKIGACDHLVNAPETCK